MHSKKGVSSIVVTVLIILISLVAIGILWVFISPFLFNSTSSFDNGIFTTSLEIQQQSVMINESNNSANLLVKRNAGAGNVIGLNILVTDVTGDSVRLRFDGPLGELETKLISIDYSGRGLGELKSIAVGPILLNENGKEVNPNPITQYNIRGTEIPQQQGGDNPPQITNIAVNPSSPAQNQPVTISATIIDEGQVTASASITPPGAAPINLVLSANGNVYSGQFTQTSAIGTYPFTISANDNVNPAVTGQGSFQINDGTLPTVTISNIPSVAQGQASQLDATINDNSGLSHIVVNVKDSSNNVVYTERVPQTGSFTSTTSYHYQHSFTASTAGTYTLTIDAYDLVQNLGSATSSFVVSSNPPTVSVTHSPSIPNLGQQVTITATTAGSLNQNNPVTIGITKNGNNIVAAGTPMTLNGGNYVYSLTIGSNVNDAGTYSITVTASGPGGSSQNTDTFTVPQPPYISFTSGTPSSGSTISQPTIGLIVNEQAEHYSFLDLDNSLVLWLRMDNYDSSSGRIFDSSGKQNDFRRLVSGGPPLPYPIENVIIPGKYGKAWHGDSTSPTGYLIPQSTNPSDLILSNRMTISFWFKDEAGAQTNGIFNRGNDYSCFDNTQGTLTCNFGIASGVTLTTSTALPRNVWKFVTITLEPISNGYKSTLYIDGQNTASDQRVGVQFVTSNSGVLHIGNSAAQYTRGSIDEFMIFKRVLSQSEINSLYNARSTAYQNTFTLAPGSHSFKGTMCCHTDGQPRSTEVRQINS